MIALITILFLLKSLIASSHDSLIPYKYIYGNFSNSLRYVFKYFAFSLEILFILSNNSTFISSYIITIYLLKSL